VQRNLLKKEIKITCMDRRTNLLGRNLIAAGLTLSILLVFGLVVDFTPAHAGAIFSAPLCGAGSAPEYGFTYDMQQAHWTVNWEAFASEQAVSEVDAVLDQLDADSIAQTMILIKPQEETGNRVNCAVHFLRYMKLGNPSGERKDNGFVFLIVVESTRIDVHYAVGLGLPALTAPELTSLNRAAEAAYQSSQSMDEALLTLVRGFDTVARNKYAPLISAEPTPPTIDLPPLPSGPLGILAVCGLLCVGIFFLLFVLWVLSQLGRMGINFNPSGFGSRGSGIPWGGGRGGGSGMRGGGGSGRSGRGN
jgi:hypothetical protein